MRRRLGASSWKCKPQLLYACVHAVATVNNTLAYHNTQLGGLQTARIAGRDAAPAQNLPHSKGGLAGTPVQVVQTACLPHPQLVALPAGRTHITSHQRQICQNMQLSMHNEWVRCGITMIMGPVWHNNDNVMQQYTLVDLPTRPH